MSHPLSTAPNGSGQLHPPSFSRPNGLNGSQGQLQKHSVPPSLLRPPTRIDIGRIKQELHDTLGEDGLPYWKALNGYLLGQIGRGEMEGLVREWLKGDKGATYVTSSIQANA